MQLLDAIKVAERVLEDAEAQGFKNTAEAMRLVLNDMKDMKDFRLVSETKAMLPGDYRPIRVSDLLPVQ
ncbi:hypothetical protein ACOTTU_24465 [Roseobacter sp. EG26]|uniref:hypothetical protein n=1 Tax=Roseobacter sp. EG26 TaxID=3412477 RepID=UPI003CE48CA4